MKIHHTLPLLLLVGCGPTAAPPHSAPPTANSTTTHTMTCSLTTWKDHKTLPDPTEADIRAAVKALDDSQIGPRLALAVNGGATNVELSGTPRDGFALDYRDAAARAGNYVYASKKTDLSAETITKVLVAARNGAPDWTSLVEWEKLKM